LQLYRTNNIALLKTLTPNFFLFCLESEQQGPSWHQKKDNPISDEGSVFARLEETRAELESQLGMDTFMEAYSECQVRKSMVLA